MEKRTRVKIIKKSFFKKYIKADVGDIGYIDGYLADQFANPYAVVVIPNKRSVELIPFNALEIIDFED